MTPSKMLRPVLVCLTLSGAGLMTASCGMVEGDPHRFENLAEAVADIPLDGSQSSSNRTGPMRTAGGQGFRPASLDTGSPSPNASEPTPAAGNAGGLRVEVMDPHDLWDARDGLRRTIREETSGMAQAAAPMMARAVVQHVSSRMSGSRAPETQALRPAVSHEPEASRAANTTIQLGAYSSEAAARSAWATVSNGAAQQALKGLSPMFERVTVNGKPFTRLKVAAPATAAIAICHAVAVSDPWCARRT